MGDRDEIIDLLYVQFYRSRHKNGVQKKKIFASS